MSRCVSDFLKIPKFKFVGSDDILHVADDIPQHYKTPYPLLQDIPPEPLPYY